MSFKVDDRVVYPAFGIGRVVALVPKSFFEAESQMYYEVTGDRSTVWVQIDEGSARGQTCSIRLLRPQEWSRHDGALQRNHLRFSGPLHPSADESDTSAAGTGLASDDKFRASAAQCESVFVRGLRWSTFVARDWLNYIR